MHLRLIPVTPRLVERLKAAQIAMFGDPSHGGRLHEEVVQTARGPEHRWVAGEAAPKPKKAGPPKTPEKGKDPNDKRTFELEDLINVHKKAQAIPRHHVYQAALQAWNHDPEARERYKEAMVEDTSAGEGPAHQRLRLWYAKGRLRETMKGLDEATFLEAVEALKALAPEIGPPPVRNRQTHPFVGTIRIPGLPKIRVETKKGQTRSGVDPDGNAWSVVMPAHYGEFTGTRGVDGDPVDVFVGPDAHAPFAYVFHMSRLGEGGYDEDKVACGFKTREDAERCLRDAYDRAGIFHAPPKRLTVAELAHWLADPENKGRMVDAGREMAKGGQIANAPGFVLDPATHRWTRATPQPEKMRTGAVKVDEQAVQSLATKVKAVLPTTASADGFDRKVHVRGAGSLHMGRVQMTGADGVLRSVTAHLHHGSESANPASIRGALRVAHQGDGDGTASTEHELHITVPQSPSGGHDAAAFENRLHSVIHHELAHLSDPQVHQPGRGDAHLGDGDTDKAKYVNDPREITARVAQVARELNRRPSVRAAKTADLSAFMSGSSPTWRAVEEHLTPENRRRFLKMAANVYQNHREGTSGPDLVMKAVPVLSLTGGPVRVARVQVATEPPAGGQGLAEAIREGEDIGDGGQDDDAPTQAPEVCKDANCRNPAHGHPPETAKSLPAHLEID